MNKTYYNELKEFKKINDDELIIKLYKKFDSGDTDAINQLVKSNLKFVVKIANEYKNTIKDNTNIISIDDLISEGNFGLMIAVNKFKISYGVKFSTYALYWIKKTIQDSINANTNTIRIPANKTIVFRKINKIINQMTQSNECSITRYQLEDLELFTKDELDAYYNQKELISIDEQYNIQDDVNDEFDQMILAEQKRLIPIALKHLTPQERMVIKMTYGIDQTPVSQYEIWKLLNVTRQRVAQIRWSALAKLKELLKNQL